MSSSSAAASQPTTPARRSIEFGGELAARGVFNSSNYAAYRKTMSATQKSAEQRALLDDEDLDSYFEAFPDVSLGQSLGERGTSDARACSNSRTASQRTCPTRTGRASR